VAGWWRGRAEGRDPHSVSMQECVHTHALCRCGSGKGRGRGRPALQRARVGWASVEQAPAGASWGGGLDGPSPLPPVVSRLGYQSKRYSEMPPFQQAHQAGPGQHLAQPSAQQSAGPWAHSFKCRSPLSSLCLQPQLGGPRKPAPQPRMVFRGHWEHMSSGFRNVSALTNKN
jgi:hypothetical protein